MAVHALEKDWHFFDAALAVRNPTPTILSKVGSPTVLDDPIASRGDTRIILEPN